MNRTTLKPLVNLAVAAMFAQSAALPAWGEHLLSCGFTNALRIIQSADEVKRHSTARQITVQMKPAGLIRAAPLLDQVCVTNISRCELVAARPLPSIIIGTEL